MRELEFTDVDWLNTQGGLLHTNFKNEARLYFGPDVFGKKGERISGDARATFDRFMLTACRRLALNSEEDTRYREASNFRRMAFALEASGHRRQLKGWANELGNYFRKPPKGYRSTIRSDFGGYTRRLVSHLTRLRYDFVHTLYNVLSGYGERGFQAFMWLLIMWSLFAFLYVWKGDFVDSDGVEKEMRPAQAMSYSLQVLTLQKPDLKPNDTTTTVLYAMETIWAPIQLALFALAIRRKFMR